MSEFLGNGDMNRVMWVFRGLAQPNRIARQSGLSLDAV